MDSTDNTYNFMVILPFTIVKDSENQYFRKSVEGNINHA